MPSFPAFRAKSEVNPPFSGAERETKNQDIVDPEDDQSKQESKRRTEIFQSGDASSFFRGDFQG
jgi:hypothetical protein